MTQNTLNEASKAQIIAADPTSSTWLSANAGSGKTRVLTNRVARLLLGGVDPQQILCLTFTKAAAAEMQNRLFDSLGKWAMMQDSDLRPELTTLGENVTGSDGERLRRARTLFARAIETPGGLKIQTIHSFCASLLRRYPIEAGVSPMFQEMDDRNAELLRQEVANEMSSAPETSALVASVLRQTNEHSFQETLVEIVSNKTKFDQKPSWTAYCELFDVPETLDEKRLEASLFDGTELSLISELVPVMLAAGTSDKKAAEALGSVEELSLAALDRLQAALLTNSGTVKKRFPTKKVQEGHPDLTERLLELAERVVSTLEYLKRFNCAKRSYDLATFAHVYLNQLEEKKRQRGLLDFDDLILKTCALLKNPSVAAWVLYRLDGGIGHVLVDEAQDTSPLQWEVIRLISQEFTSGQGARDNTKRTLFVVGDPKQSIYSFQGADADAFQHMRLEFGQKLRDGGTSLASRALAYSFRSAPAILKAVDATFTGQIDAGFDPSQTHLAFDAQKPGRVDIWPLIEPEKHEITFDWTHPTDVKPPVHHTVRLAQAIANQIAEMLRPGSRFKLPDGASMRAIKPGDIMVLVQGRQSGPFKEIIRACKSLGLPIAGADRLRVWNELAVKDLLSLMAFLSMQDDDLSLAVALKSPLFGWSEDELFQLAAHRQGKPLWQALRESAKVYPETLQVLTDLRNKTDFLRPYELLQRILIQHEGRARLIARLGPECEDGIEALLAQSLVYEETSVPSLTGFLEWAKADDLDIKREFDSQSDLIRVMTVHGAKGLEAPIVILPDCVKKENHKSDAIVDVEGLPCWKPKKPDTPEIIEDVISAQRAASNKEKRRLLYVAMTRAESWLIIAGAGELRKDGDDWYALVQAGLQSLNTRTCEGIAGKFERYQTGNWDVKADIASTSKSEKHSPLEEFFNEIPRSPKQRKPRLTPSDLGGAKALPSPNGLSEDIARERGTYVHVLIERLSLAPKDTWPNLLENTAVSEALTDDLVSEARSEALACVTNPSLAWVFDPSAHAEVALHGGFHEREILGVIDRMIISPNKITVIDFKSNLVVPETPSACPEGILRQMAAYEHMLNAIYPSHDIETGIVWTRTGQYMPLATQITSAALSRWSA